LVWDTVSVVRLMEAARTGLHACHSLGEEVRHGEVEIRGGWMGIAFWGMTVRVMIVLKEVQGGVRLGNGGDGRERSEKKRKRKGACELAAAGKSEEGCEGYFADVLLRNGEEYSWSWSR
jgi:hypothetical protein